VIGDASRRRGELDGWLISSPRSQTLRDRARAGIEQGPITEGLAIESCSEIVTWLGTHDSTSRRMLEDIPAVEEEHADDLLSSLQDVSPA
jgi:bacterioferritin (cytochrome b1)